VVFRVGNFAYFGARNITNVYTVDNQMLFPKQSDVFSFGVIQLESIGRVDADPDSLPRTQNFGVDYVAFAAEVAPADAPSEFLRHAFTCVQVRKKKYPIFSR
jgi:hypothetical protein